MDPFSERLETWKKASDAGDAEFLESHREPKNPIEPGTLVSIEGTVSRRDGESQLVADSVTILKIPSRNW
jgi:hypothetical protein